MLFAATGPGVFCSTDAVGSNWVDCSNGLPEWPNGSAIQIVTAGDERSAYYATYGWGVFRASLEEDEATHIPEIDGAQAKILFGIIQGGGGVEIVGNRLVRVPPRGPARQLALALGVQTLASQLETPAGERLRDQAVQTVRQIVATMRPKGMK